MFLTFSICDESQHSLATMLGALSATPDTVVFFPGRYRGDKYSNAKNKTKNTTAPNDFPAVKRDLRRVSFTSTTIHSSDDLLPFRGGLSRYAC